LTEIALLGGVATLVGHPIEYDPVAGKIVNCSEANALLHREYAPAGHSNRDHENTKARKLSVASYQFPVARSLAFKDWICKLTLPSLSVFVLSYRFSPIMMAGLRAGRRVPL